MSRGTRSKVLRLTAQLPLKQKLRMRKTRIIKTSTFLPPPARMRKIISLERISFRRRRPTWDSLRPAPLFQEMKVILKLSARFVLRPLIINDSFILSEMFIATKQ